MYRQIPIVREFSAYHTTVERWEELCTGAYVSPFAERIDLVIVGVMDAVMLKCGYCLVVIIAIRSIRATYHPKVVEVG